jgi:uncharacterized protein
MKSHRHFKKRFQTMSIQQQINDGIKDAMKAKDQNTLTALRGLKSALTLLAVEKDLGPQGELDVADVLPVIRKQIKQRQDSIAGFLSGNRPELAAKEESEIVVLQKFLPQEMSAEELEQLVVQVIQELGATSKKEMGAVMKLVTARAEGRADGKALSAAVGMRLS